MGYESREQRQLTYGSNPEVGRASGKCNLTAETMCKHTYVFLYYTQTEQMIVHMTHTLILGLEPTTSGTLTDLLSGSITKRRTGQWNPKYVSSYQL